MQRDEYGVRVTLEELRGISRQIGAEIGQGRTLDVVLLQRPDIDLHVSSTYYRNSQDGAFVPKPVNDFAKANGYYGHPAIDPLTGKPVTESWLEWFQIRLEPISREIADQISDKVISFGAIALIRNKL